MRSSRAIAALLAAAVLAGPASGGATSLWTSRSGSLVTDIKASRAGDVLTIVIDESSVATQNATTDLKRDSNFNSAFNPPAIVNRLPSWLQRIFQNSNTSSTGTSEYKGSGEAKRTDKTTAQMTARVVRVLDNGNLLLEGRRIVVTHQESLTVVVTGQVRPQDVGADNLVRSSSIADAEIRIEGKGSISQRQQPGVFQRLFDWLGWF